MKPAARKLGTCCAGVRDAHVHFSRVLMPDSTRLPRRHLRFFLRDFRLAEAYALMPDGLSLSSYLANRRGYLHLLDVRWQPTPDRVDFAVLRTDQVLYAASIEHDVALVNAVPAARPHGVELLVDGGLYLRGGLMLSPRQRLGDFLESAGAFVPLLGVELLRSEPAPRRFNVRWGDIVLNQDVIQSVWETETWKASPQTLSGGPLVRVPDDTPLI
jgi:hypothetical protein